jgi:hypothetical protein
MSSLDDYLPERAVSFFSRDFFFLGQTKIFFSLFIVGFGVRQKADFFGYRARNGKQKSVAMKNEL